MEKDYHIKSSTVLCEFDSSKISPKLFRDTVRNVEVRGIISYCEEKEELPKRKEEMNKNGNRNQLVGDNLVFSITSVFEVNTESKSFSRLPPEVYDIPVLKVNSLCPL